LNKLSASIYWRRGGSKAAVAFSVKSYKRKVECPYITIAQAFCATLRNKSMGH